MSLPWEPNALRANPGFSPLKENQARIKAFTANASQWAHTALTDSSLCMRIQRKQILKTSWWCVFQAPCYTDGCFVAHIQILVTMRAFPHSVIIRCSVKVPLQKENSFVVFLAWFTIKCKTKDWSLTVLICPLTLSFGYRFSRQEPEIKRSSDNYWNGNIFKFVILNRWL